MADLIKILGIDPGFGRLGYSVISRDGNNYAVECMGCLETYSDTEYEQRLLSIGTDVEKIIFEKKPDIVALQETKTVDEDFPLSEIHAAGYQAVFSGQKSYNGVALLSRLTPAGVMRDIANLDDAQRRLEEVCGNGGSDDARNACRRQIRDRKAN